MRAWFPALAFGLVLTVTAPASASDGVEAMVYKSPTCGCCTGWAQHLAEEGFHVRTRNVETMEAVKQLLKVPEPFQSCHTAMIDGYVVEGHVPAEAIQKLLRERPDIRGIALPGMPVGTPGMPGPKEETWTVYTLEDQPKVFWRK